MSADGLGQGLLIAARVRPPVALQRMPNMIRRIIDRTVPPDAHRSGFSLCMSGPIYRHIIPSYHGSFQFVVDFPYCLSASVAQSRANPASKSRFCSLLLNMHMYSEIVDVRRASIALSEMYCTSPVGTVWGVSRIERWICGRPLARELIIQCCRHSGTMISSSTGNHTLLGGPGLSKRNFDQGKRATRTYMGRSLAILRITRQLSTSPS